MLYLDYDWNLDRGGLLFDKAINFDKLGWEEGDCFRLIVDENGRYRLKKLDILEEFLIKGSNNG